MNRAYSTIEFKSVDGEARTLEGIASTPAPDRMNDVVEPLGMEFKLPYPFLYQHDSRKPIGNVVEARATKDGLKIKVQIAKEGVAPYIDEAWALIKAGLVRGLSIGFRSLEESFDKALNGYRYIRTEIMETSSVTIPANAEATITAIKSIAGDELAALGKTVPTPAPVTKSTGVSVFLKDTKMTIKEQIQNFENTRAAKAARMKELMDKAAEEGRTLDAAEATEYDTIEGEVKDIDSHLTRLNKHADELARSAKIVTPEAGKSPEAASAARGGSVISVRGANLPPGTGFVRFAIAMAASKGNRIEAMEYAKSQPSWKDQTPFVEKMLSDNELFRLVKAPVAAGTTTTTGWASQLVDYTNMASEFIEYLRPQTIIGKLPTIRRVPFNIQMPSQTAGSSSAWVGQGARKPITKLTFSSKTLGFAKAASIVVLNDELVRFSSPSVEAIVRQDMSEAMVQFLDGQFIDPSVTVSANVSPASITNGATTTAASGTTADDLRADFLLAITDQLAANISPSGSYWAMQPAQAVSISLMLNALGQPEFPGINADGGTLLGYPVVTSNSCASGVVTFMKPSEILLADDGGVSIDISKDASLVMDDGGSPTETTMVSMFQNNMVAIRVERYINWARRRDDAVYYLTSCNYGGAS